MASIEALKRRIDSLLAMLEREQRQPEQRLPYLVIDFDTGEDLPGYEAHNQEQRAIAQRLRCNPKVYGFDPEVDEGSEDEAA